MFNLPTERKSPTETRRTAPLHFWSRADNARMTARYLWDASEASMETAATAIGYNSSTPTAAFEAFSRESSLALELIIKAVIATQLENGVARMDVVKIRPDHNLPILWSDAQLPKLARNEKLHLLQAAICLHWAGRYAAPKKDETLYENLAAIEKLQEVDARFKQIKLVKPQPLDWNHFETLYQMAANSFWDIQRRRSET